ncbi:MAG: BrnA antitoxin family protein [Bryobacteraceae bacterium]
MKKAEQIVNTTGIKPLTLKQRNNLRKLTELPESEINFSDIPEIKDVKVIGRGPLTAEDRKQLLALSRLPDSELLRLPLGLVEGKFYRPRKTSLTMRLDADVVDWLRGTGEGYQTRVNAYLRELMERNAKA